MTAVATVFVLSVLPFIVEVPVLTTPDARAVSSDAAMDGRVDTASTSHADRRLISRAPRQVEPLGLEPWLERFNRDEDDRRLIEWARARFDEAGLVLPAAIIGLHRNSEPCEGNQGLFTMRESLPRVLVCATHPDPMVDAQIRAHVMLHELAHLWAHESLPEAVAAAFLADRELERWNDGSDRWSDRGTEQVAEILAWGLADRRPALITFGDSSCERLQHGFVLLTNKPPINPDIAC